MNDAFGRAAFEAEQLNFFRQVQERFWAKVQANGGTVPQRAVSRSIDEVLRSAR